MTGIDNNTLRIMHDLLTDIDGFIGANIYPASEYVPKGKIQECDLHGIDQEWVNQFGPGMYGDDFNGTVTWKLGDYYLVAGFNT